MTLDAQAFAAPIRFCDVTRIKDTPQGSPSSVFQLLSLSSPVSVDRVAQTPRLTPEGVTAFKTRRGSRLGAALATATARAASPDFPLHPEDASPGICAFLAQQAGRDTRREQQQLSAKPPPADARPTHCGLPPSHSARSIALGPHPHQPPLPPIRTSGDSFQVPEPTFCTTPPRAQRPAQYASGGAYPGAHGSPVRFNRVRPAIARNPSLDRGESHSLNLSTSSGTISRSSSLNDAKVLMATQLRRSDSLIMPSLFKFGEHFELQAVIGSSRNSEVYRARHRLTDELFAIKRSRHRFSSRSHRESCLHEMAAVAALPHHPHLMSQYRAWQQDGHFYIQMELCEGGSLDQLLLAVQDAGRGLEDAAVWQVLAEVGSGLAALHAAGVLHLDVKPANVYADAAGHLKLGDFGLAVLRHEWEWQEGDGDYVAPELLSSATEPSAGADMYSLGATAYECATGRRLPRSGPAREGTLLLPLCSEALRGVIKALLQPEPSARPSALELLAMVQRLHGGPQGQPESPKGAAVSPIGGLVKAATPLAHVAPPELEEARTPVHSAPRAPLMPPPVSPPRGLAQRRRPAALQCAAAEAAEPPRAPQPVRRRDNALGRWTGGPGVAPIDADTEEGPARAAGPDDQWPRRRFSFTERNPFRYLDRDGNDLLSPMAQRFDAAGPRALPMTQRFDTAGPSALPEDTPCTPNLGCSADGSAWDLHFGCDGALAGDEGLGHCEAHGSSEDSEGEESCIVDSLSFQAAAMRESSDGEVEQSESLPRSAFEERALVDIRTARRSQLTAGMKRTLSRTITGSVESLPDSPMQIDIDASVRLVGFHVWPPRKVKINGRRV